MVVAGFSYPRGILSVIVLYPVDPVGVGKSMGGLVVLARRLSGAVVGGVEVVEDGFSSGLGPDDLYITHYNNRH